LGPTSQSEEVIIKMKEAGMDFARLNLSHGDYQWHKKMVETVKEIGGVSVIVDLPGPKIRIGDLKEKVTLKRDKVVHFTTRSIIGYCEEIPINYSNLPREVDVDGHIFINDGLIKVRIISIDNDLEGFHGQIVTGGDVVSRKGLNVPGAAVSIRPPTKNDLKGIEFGVDVDADWIAMSFIRDRLDVENTIRAIKDAGGDQPVISKIEHQDAVNHIDDIIDASDGVMVARGDLGIEVLPWEVPILQKNIIARSNEMGKPVIVATQMLDSMVVNPRPSRAEVSDVANAIIDGADAVMLSEETAVGDNPVEAVNMMNMISLTAEQNVPRHRFGELKSGLPLPDVIGGLVSWATETINPVAIFVVTRSGFSARMVSKHRPRTRILALTSKKIGRRVRLYWGVEPLDVEWTSDRDELLIRAVKRSLEEKIVSVDDIIFIVSGSTLDAPGKTSTFEVLGVKDIINQAALKKMYL
jgi:pyruvate kinase